MAPRIYAENPATSAVQGQRLPFAVAQGPSPESHAAGHTARRQFRRFLQSRCYFVTANTHNRRRIFSDQNACLIVLDNLAFYRDRGDFWLHAYIIMPDHLHLLLTPVARNLSDVMRNVKSYIARQLIDELAEPPPVWQARFHDQMIRDERHFVSAVEYIHANPVKADICTSAEGYAYSSASVYAGAGQPRLPVQALDGSRLGP